jgi:hypothetical protein
LLNGPLESKGHSKSGILKSPKMKIFSDVSARPLMKSIKILSSLIDDEGGLYTQPKTNDTVLLCTPRNSASIPFIMQFFKPFVAKRQATIFQIATNESTSKYMSRAIKDIKFYNKVYSNHLTICFHCFRSLP